MNGLWKETVSGWDRKGNKRRKQTRNNTIRDKARQIIHIYSEENDVNDKYSRKSDKAVLTNSAITVHKFTGSSYMSSTRTKYPEYVQMWKIRYHYGSLGESKVCEAFLNNGKWLLRDKHTLSYSFEVSWFKQREEFVERICPLDMFKPDWTKERAYKNRKSENINVYGTTYLYSKPLPDWKRSTFYDDGKRRKYAQKYANSMDRQKIREWIGHKDWDKEVKTHALSKSILWEIW